MPRRPGSKLTEQERVALMRDVARGEYTAAEITRMHGVNRTTVGHYRRMLHGRQKGSRRPSVEGSAVTRGRIFTEDEMQRLTDWLNTHCPFKR